MLSYNVLNNWTINSTNKESVMESYSTVRVSVMACMCKDNKVVFRSRTNGRFVNVKESYKQHLIQDLVCEMIISDMKEDDNMENKMDYTDTVEGYSQVNGMFDYDIEESDKEYEFTNPYTEEQVFTTDKLEYLQWKDAYSMHWQEVLLGEEMANNNRTPSGASWVDGQYHDNKAWIMERMSEVNDRLDGMDENTRAWDGAMQWKEELERRLLKLEADALAGVLFPYFSGDEDGEEPGMVNPSPMEEYKAAYMEEVDALNPQWVMPIMFHDWKPMWESRERNLKHVLRMLNLKLGRTQSWEEVHALINWAKDANRAESYAVKGEVKYVAQSNPMGYLGNQAIMAFVYGWFGMRKTRLGLTDEDCVRVATMWADKHTGRVARDYRNNNVPAANRFVTREQIMEVNEQSKETWAKYMVWVKAILMEKY